jgi:alcohol dehydrogenase, propanol-preferring
MRAWMFEGVDRPLAAATVADPVPGQGEVVVDVRAAGLCHTDVGVLTGAIEGFIRHTPIVLGHEIAGEITAVGPGTAGWHVGDRVVCSPFGPGGITSPDYPYVGQGRNGGFAERAVIRTGELVRIPSGVPFEQAATATDAGLTSYHAVHAVGGVAAGMRVGIIGLGGLGVTAARLAVLAGARVVAADTNPSVRDSVAGLGLEGVVGEATELADHQTEVILDFAGFGTTTAGAIQAVRRGGRIVQVGLGRTEALISTYLLVLKQIELVGAVGGTPAETATVLDLRAAGDLAIATETVSFDGIPRGLERLGRGEAPGRRLVAVTS